MRPSRVVLNRRYSMLDGLHAALSNAGLPVSFVSNTSDATAVTFCDSLSEQDSARALSIVDAFDEAAYARAAQDSRSWSVVYAGQKAVRSARFVALCQWPFQGAARRTLHAVQVMAHHEGAGQGATYQLRLYDVDNHATLQAVTLSNASPQLVVIAPVPGLPLLPAVLELQAACGEDGAGTVRVQCISQATS